ncbi:type II and III secretion system protein family protein [Pelagibacterium limicola]|uniref:type II and III secretion system protein family protein n=1 Tax=Pelagibacterium limicola TaxID=2791022 RepID=UPI0018AFDCA4|nr:type II and III secretion system protein family protein [Pelagibacterium limicola]
MPTKIMNSACIPLSVRRLLLAGLAALGLAMAAAPAVANSSAHLLIGHNEIGRTQHIQIGVNKSIIIDLPVEAGEVIVSQPGVANAIMRTRSRAVIQGIAAGETNIFFLDSRGSGIAVIEISVAQDATGLAATINRLIPGARVQVQSFADAVVLSGQVNSADDLEKAVAIAGQFVGGPDSVTSVINVAGGQQVMLKVTVAEVSREAVRQLGINLNASFGTSAILQTNPSLGGASGVSGNPNLLTANIGAGNFSLTAQLRALERRGAMRTLSEPTLTAISGQSAEFLAGGEFPVPVSVDADGKITYEFKEFGVRLNFTPTVRSNGIVGLVVETSVSELTTEGGINTPIVTIPATRERRASTSVELPNGATLAIGGLIEDRVRQQINALPGLGNIPILGALFRSRDFVHSQTELVILVTPMIVQPSYAQPQLPTDTYVLPTEAEAIFLGRMESLYGVGGGQGGGQFRGSVGFVLD